MTETRKTGTFDENEIIAAAKQLGIKLTNAEKDLTPVSKNSASASCGRGAWTYLLAKPRFLLSVYCPASATFAR